MTAVRTTHRPARTDPAVRAIVRSWRRLTGAGRDRDRDRSTLVACSGGADSSALALALAAAGPGAGRLVLGHIVHDLRPADEARVDHEAVERLASRLELPCRVARIRACDLPGNTEANARAARYEALARLAAGAHCRYIATAHHRDDQLETMLMRLVRGAGVRGLAGMPRARPIAGGGADLIRPMLGVGRAQAEAICAAAGWAWCEDATNRDTTRLRTAIRLGPAQQLIDLAPGAAAGATRTSCLLADAAGLIEDQARLLRARARVVCAGGSCPVRMTWDRACLAGVRPIVIGELLRQAADELTGGVGADSRSFEQVWPVARTIAEQSASPGRCTWSGVEIRMHSGRVEMMRTDDRGA